MGTARLRPRAVVRADLAVRLVCCGLCAFAPVAAAEVVVDFPGPVAVDLAAEVLSGAPLEGAGGADQYFAAGTGDGFLVLTQYRAAVGKFSILNRFLAGGRITGVIPWQGLPASAVGIVAATTDPDRILFVRVTLSPAAFILEEAVDLEEDPGTMAFAGPGPDGHPLLAVSLPGIDRICVLGEGTAGWALTQTLDAGDQPQWLAAADLDGDQIKEIYTADRGALSGSLGIFQLGLDGLYQRTGQHAFADAPQAVVGFDADLDGRDELAVACLNLPQVAFFQGDPDGLSAAGTAALTLPANSLRLAVLPGGQVGLYTANRSRGLVEFSRGTLGSWQLQSSYYPGCRPLDCTTADFNLDGLVDLVSVGGTAGIYTVMFGTDEPGLWGFSALALSGGPAAAAVADFDGDGVNDAVVANFGVSSLSRFNGTQEGGLPIRPLDHPLAFFPGVLVPLELDGDPGLELAITDPVGLQVVLADLPAPDRLVILGSVPTADQVLNLQTADVDHDGRADLVALFPGGWAGQVYFGGAGGTFPAATSLGFTFGAEDLALLDLNGDGLLDLAASDGQDRIWYRRNLTGRTFGFDAWVTAGEGAAAMAAGDIDGDLDADIAVYNSVAESLTLLENNGGGQLIRRIGSHALTGPAEGVLMQDVDQDGRQDVVLNLRQAGQIGLVLVGASWEYSVTFTYAGGADVAVFDAGDLNRDLVPDILALDESLQLGMTMLNVQRQLVAVDPQALAVVCRQGQYTIAVAPDRAGPWRLEYGALAHGGQPSWALLADPSFAAAGDVVYDRGTWFITVTSLDLLALGGGRDPGQGWLRLSVGQGPTLETLEVALAGVCPTPAGPPRPPALVWSQEPWPNPCNPVVNARFALARPGWVQAGIFDLAGRQVHPLIDGWREAGEHLLRWDGTQGAKPAAAGVYLLRVATPQARLSGKVILLK